jgi:hypothetical protein
VVVVRGAEPLLIEVLAPSLVGAGFPRGLGGGVGQRRPRPGGVGGDDAYHLLRLLDRLREEFDTRIVVHIIEPLSFGWIIRILRHRPRRYPVFLIGGRTAVAGLDDDVVRTTVAGFLGRGR